MSPADGRGVWCESLLHLRRPELFRLAGLVFTLTIKREHPAAPRSNSVIDSLLQGLRFILSHGAISFVVIAMACGMFGMRCFGALLSVYVRDILLMKEKIFGFLNTLIGIGMIGGAYLVRKFASRSTPQQLVIYGVGGMGVAVFITAFFGRFDTAAIGMLALGFFAAFIITAQTLLQKETPPEMLGRVTSTMMSLLAVAQVVALVGAGPGARVLRPAQFVFRQRGYADDHRPDRPLETQELNSIRIAIGGKFARSVRRLIQ